MRLAILLALASCGGGDRAVEVDRNELARLQLQARGELGAITPDTLATSTATLRRALASDPQDAATVAQLQLNAALSTVLYGVTIEVPATTVSFARGRPGWHDHLFAKAIKQLVDAKTPDAAREVVRSIERELSSDSSPGELHWVRGRAAQLAGDHANALRAFELGHAFAPAMIDAAYLLASTGKAAEAIARLDRPALVGHPLAALARATIRADAGVELGEAVADLKSVPANVPALAARAAVATMQIALAGERYDAVAESLKKLGSLPSLAASRGLPADCAMWARIAWAYLQLGRAGQAGRGDHRAASVTRDRCAFPQAHPLVILVDASLHLAIGRPAAATATASKIDLPWARVVAAEAQLELRDAAAAKNLVANTDPTPLGFATRLLLQQAQVLSASKTQLATELPKLAQLAASAKTQRGRHVLGATHLALGDLAAAKSELRRAITDASATSPNPRANRTRTLLADIAFMEGDLDVAEQEIGRALVLHANDQVALALQARLALRKGDADGALQKLAPMRRSGWLPPIAQLVVAEALVIRKGVTADQRDQAKKLVTSLVGNAAIARPELGRVAALVDPRLASQLGLPVGKLPGKGA